MKYNLVLFAWFLLIPTHSLWSQGRVSLRKSVSHKPVFVSYSTTVDMDQDGDLDVLSSGSVDDKLFFSENKGNGFFAKEQLIDVLIDDPVNAEVADLNGDGRLDIVTFSYFHEKIVWLENKGNNSFSGRKIISNVDGYVGRVGVADLDGDEDLDVLAANGNGLIVWYRNDGSGGFGNFLNNAIALPSNIIVPYTFFTVDLDQDGDVDVVSATGFEERIVWNENDGEGNFGEQKMIATNTEDNLIIRVVDIDKDGDIDIFSGGRSSISWYENMGNQIFSTPKVVSEAVDEVLDLSFGDLDQDGDIDIASASYDDDKIAWYENDGNENFGIQNILTVWNEWAASVEIADIDGDGHLDILTNTSGDGKIVWYENHANHGRINCVAFIDGNENGIYDSNEQPLANQIFYLAPAYVASTTSDGFGNASFYTKYGDYELSYQANPLWELTSNTSAYSLTLSKDTELPTYAFGFKPKKVEDKIVVSLSSSYFRCNRLIKYYLSVYNAGTTQANGTLTLLIDSLTQQVLEIAPQPSTTEDYKLIWNYSDLAPHQRFTVEVNTLPPSFENLGDTLTMKGQATITNENQQVIDFDNTELVVEICQAPDSNSKSFTTNLKTDHGKAYIGDTIIYTINFYNKYQEIAANIRLEDSLDRHLDWESFHILSSSHNHRATLDYDTGFLIFHFDDINLLGNDSDKRKSSGYITYGIKSLENVEENTEINNKSYNFFNANVPLITNSLVITLIENTSVSIDKFTEKNYSIHAYPNPFSDYTTIEVEGLPEGDYQLEVMDILGRKLRTLTLEDGKVRLERGKLESGVYFFRILEKKKLEVIGGGKVLVK